MIYFTPLETRDFYSGLEKTSGNYTACNFEGKNKDYICKTFHYSDHYDFPHYIGEEGIVLHLALYKHKTKPEDYILRCSMGRARFNVPHVTGGIVTKESKYINIHLTSPKVEIKREVEIKKDVGRLNYIINNKYIIQFESKEGFCLKRRINIYENNKPVSFEPITGA